MESVSGTKRRRMRVLCSSIAPLNNLISSLDGAFDDKDESDMLANVL